MATRRTRRTFSIPAMAREMRRLEGERAREGRTARRRLKELMAEHGERASGSEVLRDRLRPVSIRLDPWLIEAARLLTKIDGYCYQDKLRSWIIAGVFAEWRMGRRR